MDSINVLNISPRLPNGKIRAILPRAVILQHDYSLKFSPISTLTPNSFSDRLPQFFHYPLQQTIFDVIIEKGQGWSKKERKRERQQKGKKEREWESKKRD